MGYRRPPGTSSGVQIKRTWEIVECKAETELTLRELAVENAAVKTMLAVHDRAVPPAWNTAEALAHAALMVLAKNRELRNPFPPGKTFPFDVTIQERMDNALVAQVIEAATGKARRVAARPVKNRRPEGISNGLPPWD